MVKLSEISALNVAPFEVEGCKLQATSYSPIAVTPFKGQQKAVSAALKKLCGVGVPKVGEKVAKGDVQVIWAGLDQVFVSGVTFADLAAALKGKAAVVDQSDAWASFVLTGPMCVDVLARLCPLDLDALGEKAAARTQYAHMMAMLTRTDSEHGFGVLVMRSFGRTAWRHTVEAMESVAAQRRL